MEYYSLLDHTNTGGIPYTIIIMVMVIFISFLQAEHYHNFAIPPNQKIDSKFDKSSIMIYDSKSFLSDEALRNDLYSFTDKENNSSEILKTPRLSLLDTLDFFNFYKECKPWQSLSKCKTGGQNYISGQISCQYQQIDLPRKT